MNPRHVCRTFFNFESHCTAVFKVKCVMSFPARERQERTARNGFESIEFAICTPKGWWKKKRKKEWERTRSQARKLKRKLTIPSLFFFNVNFIATSRLFTGRSVCTPDSECRLFWLPESWRRTTPKTEVRRDTRRWRQSKRNRLLRPFLSRTLILCQLFSLFLFFLHHLSFHIFPRCLSHILSYSFSIIFFPDSLSFHANSRPYNFSSSILAL